MFHFNIHMHDSAKLEKIMLDLNDVAAAVSELNAKVEKLNTVSDGVLLIVTELNTTVQELKVKAENTVDPAAKQAIIDQIAGISQAVADQTVEMDAALTANTPAAPVVVVAEPGIIEQPV